MTILGTFLSVLLALQNASSVSGRSGSSAAEIYARWADSVVPIEVRDALSRPTSQATAFVVGPGELLTNAHAVDGGAVWARLGAVVVQARIVRRDNVNDLALLRVDVELSLRPLQFASEVPQAGTHIFVLGNPKGFERTITDGLVTSIRSIGNRPVLQMSAAISPGSSGGPVINERGEVVGVTVGLLPDAQNLNFAVPATIASAFVRNDSAVAPEDTAFELVERLIVQRDQETISPDPGSPYQKLTTRLRDLIPGAVESSNDLKRLRALGDGVSFDDELYGPIVERMVRLAPKDGGIRLALAESLERTAGLLQNAAKSAELLRRAEAEAANALELSSIGERRAYLLVLGRIQVSGSQRTEVGLTTLRQVATGFHDDTARFAALELFSANIRLKRYSEARRWFKFAEEIDEPALFYYKSYAELLEEMGDSTGAAAAYLKRANSGLYPSYCDAARTFARAPDQLDMAIASARECLRNASLKPDGDTTAAWAHRLLASFLMDRGVIDQALSEARQAVAADSTSGLAYGILADALLKAERWSEAEAAARSALRLTDGAHSFHHWALGSALFEQKRYSEAQASYEIVARMSPTSAGATYNIALCLTRQGFTNDALTWWEETLRRDPNIPEAGQIRARIQAIKVGR